ncbi:RloB domain-containing protein [Patescibacteria group bacterium]|nr:RloB domain-containing protein [Patescibacteria group bacterium]
MSRTNPYKKKKRQANKTLLVFGEGMNEEVFLKHIRKLYCYNTNVAITIKKGRGGDAKNIVLDAYKVPGEFNRIVVILDNDKPKNEIKKARQFTRDKEIELLENTPCLEHLLLMILDSEEISANSKKCKRIFEEKYIEKTKRKERYEYDKYFSKELLEKKREIIKILDYIIKIMEGK